MILDTNHQSASSLLYDAEAAGMNVTVSSTCVLSIAQAFATAPANATAVVEAAIVADGIALRAVELTLASGLSSSSQTAAVAIILSSVIQNEGCAFLRPTLLKVGPQSSCCLPKLAMSIMAQIFTSRREGWGWRRKT
jgi:hypothetical protein